MKRKLNAALLASDLAEGEYWDTAHPGLHLRVGATRKTWLYRYRMGGNQKRERLGYHPALPLSQAREAAAAIDKRIDAGLPAAVTPVIHPRSPNAVTVATLLERYEKMREAEGHRVKRLKRSMMTLRHCLKRYLDTPAAEFTKGDLRAARDAIAERAPAQANALLRNLSPVLRWAAEEDVIPTNFVGDLRKSPGKKRTRILTADELRTVWDTCEDFGDGIAGRSFARMIRFLMITGCRREEAVGMRHGHVLDGAWRQADNKASRPHKVPLPQLAIDQLGQGAAADLCFPGKRGPISGFSKLKQQLDEKASIAPWTIHDLRRTFISGLGDLGVDEMTIKATVNHAIATGALAAYMVAELEKQKRAALQAWADRLAKIHKGQV